MPFALAKWTWIVAYIIPLLIFGSANAQSPSTFRIGDLPGDYGDPQGEYTTFAAEFWRRLAYEPLFELTSKGYRPVLAKRWEKTGSGGIRIELNTNVRFHDGSYFSAKDVAASWERMKRINPTFRARAQAIAEVRVFDPLTLEFLPPPGNAVSLYALARLHIIQASAKDFERGTQTIAGTGRAILDPHRSRPGETIQLLRNRDWWRGDAGFERIEIRVLPDLPSLQYALTTGEIDVFISPLYRGVTVGDDLERIRSQLQSSRVPELKIQDYRGGFVASTRNASSRLTVDDDSIEFLATIAR